MNDERVYLNKKEGMCPMCGTAGKAAEEIGDANNCPGCGTVFNRFGVILSTRENPFNLQLN